MIDALEILRNSDSSGYHSVNKINSKNRAELRSSPSKTSET
jgi:hypothetical protein